ncbi:MAG: hypothetical protein ROZ09_05620 [Thiobacillus sp.]|jgi:hypothetical protein|uniref:hypothetical protein n=1 Tax=Thiobacillus sp. TaxID=924 RepID=UPI002895C295|nr:hypothetical protein [Thiobacillus sp.]MDT3706285.1 hypothetical protein [Thiobacillus sp.]
MTFDLQDTHQKYPDHGSSYKGEDEQVAGLPLDLLIEDSESIAVLVSYPEGRERTRFIRTALRIGIRALNQAQGRIDSESVRKEGDRMVREIETRLADYRRQTESQLTSTLKDNFDPQNGRCDERVERLVRQDSELESLCAPRWNRPSVPWPTRSTAVKSI